MTYYCYAWGIPLPDPLSASTCVSANSTRKKCNLSSGKNKDISEYIWIKQYFSILDSKDFSHSFSEFFLFFKNWFWLLITDLKFLKSGVFINALNFQVE